MPCNPPCEKRPMIGTSWWKLMGYNSPCGCCLAEKKKRTDAFHSIAAECNFFVENNTFSIEHVKWLYAKRDDEWRKYCKSGLAEEADVKVKFLEKGLKEVFAENKELKAEKLKDTIMLEEFMFEGQGLPPAEKVEMKGYWTVENVLEDWRGTLEDFHTTIYHHTCREEEIKILEKELEEKEKEIGIGMVADNERKFFIQSTKELEENVEELRKEKENMKRIWEGQNEEQEEAKSAMMILLCDKVNKLADKDDEIKKLKEELGQQNN